MLVLKKFKKTYNGRLIIKAESLQIPEGLIWIKGPNGTGKSTLLKSIAGIIPFDGDILLNGISLKKDPVILRRKVAYAEAEPFFPEILSAREIIEFVAAVREEPDDKTQELVRHFGVDKFYRQACGGYSTGMLKKVALIIALLGETELILLDEPFAFIDRETEENLTQILKTLRRQGKSLLITSHHEDPLEQLSFDWVFRIRDKQLERQ